MLDVEGGRAFLENTRVTIVILPQLRELVCRIPRSHGGADDQEWTRLQREVLPALPTAQSFVRC